MIPQTRFICNKYRLGVLPNYLPFLLFLVFSIGVNCQNEVVERTFEFYYKTDFVTSDKLKVQLVRESDTIYCALKNWHSICDAKG